MPPLETSPYSPLSAMAIDPQFISVGQMEDFAVIADRLGDDFRGRIEAARNSPGVDYRVVRRLKEHALRGSFERFRDTELASNATGRCVSRIHERSGLVARRLRPVPRAPRGTWRATVG